jgi:electron transfer flavoprotein beta subunit
MNMLVLTKRVPVTQEEELRITGEGAEVDLSRIPFRLNDWDNYAVEEALRIVEKTGGDVTALSIGDAESDEVLRRAIAMGARNGLLIEAPAIIHDPVARARILCNFIKKEGLAPDAIFAGVQSEDDQFAGVGGILAGLLRLPYASMVIGIDGFDSGGATVRRELEGGLQERIRVTLPCVLSIQSGINEPRYVSIMGVRKASRVERKVFRQNDYREGAGPAIELMRWTYPETKAGARMLSGELENQCREVIDVLREKGVCQ